MKQFEFKLTDGTKVPCKFKNKEYCNQESTQNSSMRSPKFAKKILLETLNLISMKKKKKKKKKITVITIN